MRLPGGKLDKDDRRVMQSMGKNVEVVNFEQVVERMQKETPEKYEGFKRELGRQKGIVITSKEQLLEIGKQANETKKQFDWLANLMHVERAYEIRKWQRRRAPYLAVDCSASFQRLEPAPRHGSLRPGRKDVQRRLQDGPLE